jgi:1-phosphofructokinase
MIITLTANPSVDLTLEIASYDVGEVNRALSSHKDPAGKGINVARALAKNGIPTAAIFPADALTGQWIIAAMTEVGIPTVTTSIHEEIRQNITIVDAAGTTTKINALGPLLSPDEQADLRGTIISVLDSRPAWLIAAGSLPRGLDGSFYVNLGKLAHEFGVRFAVDTSGDALAEVAHSGAADLMKPNHEELEELAGRSLPTVGDVEDFARSLLALEGSAILVSLGENGALLITMTSSIWAGHTPVIADSTVGAGDSTLAGYLAADVRVRAESLPQQEANALRISTAVAWGSAAVQLPATTVPGPPDITLDAVRVVTDPDRNLTIKELHV